jgi:DNA-binding CsgD family transcriptional regulator
MRDQLSRFRERLTDEERRLADWRAQGRPWADIAAELGVTPGAVSKQLQRAIDRVSEELGLEEG